jgi:golgin subfamily B member 1
MVQNRAILITLRAAAIVIIATGLNDVVSSALPRYEPLYLYLAAIALVSLLDGILLGLATALLSLGFYALLFMPRAELATSRILFPIAAAVAAAVIASIVRGVVRVNRRRRPDVVFTAAPTPLLETSPVARVADNAEVLAAIDELRGELRAAVADLTTARDRAGELDQLRRSQNAEREAVEARARQIESERDWALKMTEDARILRKEAERQLAEAREEAATMAGRVAELELSSHESEKLRARVAELEEALAGAAPRAEFEELRRALADTRHARDRARAEAVAEKQRAEALEGAVAEERAARVVAETALGSEGVEHAQAKKALAEERAAREVAERGLAGERAARETTQQALTAERTARETAERSLADERTARAKAETALATEGTAHARAKQALADDRTARAIAEHSLAEERTARAKVETALATEGTAHAQAKQALADERAARESAEKARGEERAAREAAEQALADERASRARAEQVLIAERAARETAERALADERTARAKAETALATEGTAHAQAKQALAAERTARESAEKGRGEERAAREAAEQALTAERAARESAEQSLAGERAQFDTKLQTIVTHLASDHETDLGQAVSDREEARAEARALTKKVATVQRRLDDLEALLGETRTAAQAEIERLRSQLATKASPAARPRVLVVHPDADVRGAAAASLDRAGYDVVSAADGLEALRVAIASQPEVVIAESSMPKMDGRELCQLLKSQKKTSHIRFILLMRATDEAPRGELPPDEVLRKPVPVETLRATLASLLTSDRRS